MKRFSMKDGGNRLWQTYLEESLNLISVLIVSKRLKGVLDDVADREVTLESFGDLRTITVSKD